MFEFAGMGWMLIVVGLGLSYLLGSISSAILVCRWMGLPDPRSEGSHNPGATNVLRIGGDKGKLAAALTLLGDMLKGVLAVLLTSYALQLPNVWVFGAGFAAFIGHLYPVFFQFKGGKGVATYLGVLLAFHLGVGVAVAAIWLFVAKVLKMSSLAALVAMSLAPIGLWFWGVDSAIVWLSVVMTLVLIWRHRSNIQRLLNQSEDQIG